MQISNKAQFTALMEEIDESLRNEGIPIHARQIQGWIRACQTLKSSLPLVGSAIPDVYQGPSLSGHIHDWFEVRYGERLKIDFSPGCFPITIRGDLYLVRLPLIFGSAAFFIDRAPRRSEQQRNRFGRYPVSNNLLDLVEDLTDNTRVVLANDELNIIADSCIVALNQCAAWQSAGNNFHNAIKDDLKLSATLAIEGIFGFSRWHSLQAAEKAIKAFIANRGAHAPHIHDLHKLHDRAIQKGLSPLAPSDLEAAQCKAEVRYEKNRSTQSEVVFANEAGRRICTQIANQLQSL